MKTDYRSIVVEKIEHPQTPKGVREVFASVSSGIHAFR